MIKKYLTTLLIMAYLVVPVASAQTKAPTSATTSAAPVQTKVDKEVQNLKDKIANKVSELQKKKKRGISGVISEISDKSIIIESEDSETFTITLDEVLTKYFVISGISKKEGTIASFEKGDFIIVVGPETDGDVVANAIYKDERYLVGAGSVTEVNAADFYIKVVTTDKESMIIDMETNTKRVLMDSKTLEFETIGFSKIKEGDTIHYVLKKTGKEREANRYSALRVMVIPQEYFIN